MTEKNQKSNSFGLTRRELLTTSGKVAAVTALAGVAIPQQVFAGQDNTIQLALVGCGGRGTGAVKNAMTGNNGPLKLVAMADVFEDRQRQSYNGISAAFPMQVDVPEDRRFIGFDSYKQAMDCLKPGDVVILATPPAFRWVHFTYAIEKGLNVFMEKPICVDAPTGRRMIELAKKAEEKNLKVGVGLMCRHCTARQELHDRIQNGEIGDVLLLRAYRATPPVGFAIVSKKPEGVSELEYQIRNFHGFLWASGGCFSDFLIHNIDESCWMKDAWPVEAKGFGGRQYRLDYVDQNFDVYTVEYTFADGSKLMLEGRNMAGCHREFASYAHGTKGSAVISTSEHYPAYSRIYKGQNIPTGYRPGRSTDPNMVWAAAQPEPNPYDVEWEHLIAAIREGKPYNEVERGAMASIVTAMGRMSCHTGQVIKLDEFMNFDHEFGPDVDKLTLASSAPLQADANGKYPIPLPGITKKREYEV